ncbi:MAG: hypothetical protein WEE50_03655 [Chloroflexota bacterium]
MATETDAARDRVLAARAALGDELEALEASARAAVDIPAKVRRSPAKAAAIAGSAGFVVLGGPRRLFGRARRAIFGPTAELPRQMLPKEIEKTLRKLGDDGDKVRGALERDFAAYAREAEKDRGVGALATAAARPLLMRGARAAAEWFFRPDEDGFQARLAEVRERARDEVAKRRAEGKSGSTAAADDESAIGGA